MHKFPKSQRLAHAHTSCHVETQADPSGTCACTTKFMQACMLMHASASARMCTRPRSCTQEMSITYVMHACSCTMRRRASMHMHTQTLTHSHRHSDQLDASAHLQGKAHMHSYTATRMTTATTSTKNRKLPCNPCTRHMHEHTHTHSHTLSHTRLCKCQNKLVSEHNMENSELKPRAKRKGFPAPTRL
jgi:hypothetical protein